MKRLNTLITTPSEKETKGWYRSNLNLEGDYQQNQKNFLTSFSQKNAKQ